MSKESFQYPATEKIFHHLEETSNRSGVSRAQAFEDFLLMSVCALSGGRMEDQYLQAVAKHTSGKPGKRGCDSISHMFGELVAAMEQDSREQMRDIIGDLFQGGITYGERGQFLTPMPVCELMARMTIEGGAPPEDSETSEADTPDQPSRPEQSTERRSVFDPCSGSGRMLLAAAHINRHWEFIGQDVDLRCTRMTALNLAFRNLYGYAIHGNTLALEKKLFYRTGFDGRGFIREIPLAAFPLPVQQATTEVTMSPDASFGADPESPPPGPAKQLRLF